MTDNTDQPAPPKRIRSALNTVSRCRKEMASLYRASRSGKMPLADLTRYVFVLSTISKSIVDEQLEKRIEDLERGNPAALPDRRAPYESTEATQVSSEAPTSDRGDECTTQDDDDPPARRH